MVGLILKEVIITLSIADTAESFDIPPVKSIIFFLKAQVN